jgi:PAS domain S-box-containing protein
VSATNPVSAMHAPEAAPRFEPPWRAIVPIALSVCIVAIALFVTQLVRDIDSSRRSLVERQTSDLDFIEQSIGDAVVVGDYAAAEQLLRAATRDHSIRHVALSARNGARLQAGDESPEVLEAPDWLVRFAALPLGPDSRPIVVGGVRYGVLTLRRSAALAYDELWNDMGYQALLIGLAAAAAIALAVALIMSRAHLQNAVQGTQKVNDELRAEVGARREAERIALENEERFRDLTSMSSDWYWEQDRELRFTVTAARTDERGGLTPGQHVGKKRWELPGTEPVNTNWDDHRALLEARRPFRDLVLRRPAPDGSLRYVLVSGSPIIDADGSFAGYRGVAKDITERYTAEQALRAAKEAAEAGLHAKNQFLANISHELRTPMTGVLGMTDLLLGTQLDTRQRDYCNLAQRSATSLLRVIEDMIELANLDADRVVLNSETFDLQALAADIVGLVSGAAAARGIAVHSRVDPQLHTRVIGDQRKLRQVLMHLMDNALKFTQVGSIALEMLGEPTRADAGNGPAPVRFRVIDTGIGFETSQLERLFGAFTKADESSTRRHGGLGAGLAIARQLVERMGGKLTAESRPGRGSTFEFVLAFPPAATA